MTEGSAGAHAGWDELAAAHALHALEPDEAARLLAHAEGCVTCRQRLDEFSLVAAQLGSLADDESEPPAWADIRPRLVEGPSVRRPPTPLAPVLPLRRRLAVRALGAAAAAIVVVGAVVAGWQLSRPSNATPGTAALAACRHQNGCTVVQLHGRNGDDAAVLVEAGRVSLVPVRLPAPPADRMYVLWQLPRDGSPIPVVTFRSSDGQSSSVPLVTGYRDTAAFAVSLEAAGPMPTRPTDVVAVGAAGS